MLFTASIEHLVNAEIMDAIFVQVFVFDMKFVTWSIVMPCVDVC